MATLGIEEEYLLLDPSTGLPVHKADEVAGYLHQSPRVTEDEIQRELLSCQLETATPVSSTLTEAEEYLLNFRAQLEAAARKASVVAAGTASAPFIEDHYPDLTDKERYRDLRDSAPGIVGDQFVNGLHVHVSIPDRESGVQALNRIREWLPAIVAMSTNSPYWLGRDSGFGSWRVVHYRRWPVQGCPPVFQDAADYERRVKQLVATGAIIDRGVLTWMARLSDSYPTLEVRAGDAQLEARDSVLLAALIRGLVNTAVEEAERDLHRPVPEAELLDAAMWQAAREGLTSTLVDPVSAELVPAKDRIRALLEFTGAALEAEKDTEWVQAGLAGLWEKGTGAERQRRARDSGGTAGLLELYRSSLSGDGESGR
ncbi:glutamate--cysteine ligase [Arthrobacter sp. Sa2BUA2]|uniref:Putative glutamate--cysteine ligase 2 n=1 Tax=Arthrobacter pullicola TaxID=2762224 RepID=A0ABR8YJ58_9MICC|nr:glutamate--cysteine ligase [Arthrobacter pullicola]MBD8044239.1 glutamate--cysteine ligase [Arthrobacter pullicola]